MIRAILDTNVLVYTDEVNEPDKTPPADLLIDELERLGAMVVSGQALSEYACVMLKKWGDPQLVAARVEHWARVASIILIEPHVVTLAIEGAERFGFHFYDAQVWAAARVSGIPLVLSEDFQDRLVADGVTFRNPFAPGFDLDEALAG